MSGRVVDASALLLAVAGKDAAAAALLTDLTTAPVHAPHLVDAEVGNVLRRHEVTGLLTPSEALAALGAARTIVTHRYPHTGPLSERAWELRHNLSYYDALYVALAEHLDLTLLTADSRLSRAPNLSCTVTVV